VKIFIDKLPPIGIAHFTVIDVKPVDLVDLAHRIGFQSVGLRLHPAFPGAPFYEILTGTQAMRDMKERLLQTGISVYDIEFVVVDGPFVPESMLQVLESAAELGAKRLSICGDDPDHQAMVAKFARLCELSGRFGMGVDLETMAWRQVSTFQKAARLVKEARQPNGGILIDALHLARSGGTPDDLKSVPASFIRSFQLCDAHAGRPATADAIIQEARGGRLPPGEGTLPLNGLLAEIPDNVTLSVEVPNTGDSAESHAQRVYDAARRVLSAAALNSKV
jgi:sugar phosphate isomerase/epimerase